ncbi:helix-turn-helix domain-containing protein [Pseudomonas sp. NFR16]|uniref:helix-turn-helix domain-containing protein n=1 Tax=Pseudomonas sp. NFR16 TaxID=1566248 RepID=UPI0008C1CD1C|nr:helix-turn-helix transcriptional regulator [Pseudomonas sp. NFR16]SEJ77266.1 Helix-turn-helix domain-containing protein [Pseudomonas sp. NFR16]
MSLKSAIAAVLKALREARGVSQNNLAQVSSRTYVSKLEGGHTRPPLEILATLSSPLGLSPLALVALTLATQTGQSIRSLMSGVEGELIELPKSGAFNELQIAFSDGEAPARLTARAKHRHALMHPGRLSFVSRTEPPANAQLVVIAWQSPLIRRGTTHMLHTLTGAR